MNKYHRLAHVSKIYKGTGSRVSRGEEIAEIGKPSNGTAHLHYCIFNEKPASFLEYTRGMSREQVEQKYYNPKEYLSSSTPIVFSHFGWEYLEYTGELWHPGVDLNGPGAGNADFGQVIESPVSGEIVYVRDTKIKDAWGGMIVIKETTAKDEPITKVKDIATELADIKLSIDEIEKRVQDLELQKTITRMGDISIG